MNALKIVLKSISGLCLFVGLVFTISCSNPDVEVGGVTGPYTHRPTTPTIVTAPSIYVWGANFTPSSSAYVDLLKSCSRCGLKRVRPGTGLFGAQYEHTIWASKENPRICSNWGSGGYLQIEFAAHKLPTEATVIIQPKYSHGSKVLWGEPFSVKSQALPINKNRGFQIILSPGDGLGGNKELIIKSTSSIHLDASDLEVEVIYGSGRSDGHQSLLISTTLRKQVKRPIPLEKVKHSCLQYTN